MNHKRPATPPLPVSLLKSVSHLKVGVEAERSIAPERDFHSRGPAEDNIGAGKVGDEIGPDVPVIAESAILVGYLKTKVENYRMSYC